MSDEHEVQFYDPKKDTLIGRFIFQMENEGSWRKNLLLDTLWNLTFMEAVLPEGNDLVGTWRDTPTGSTEFTLFVRDGGISEWIAFYVIPLPPPEPVNPGEVNLDVLFNQEGNDGTPPSEPPGGGVL